MQATQASRQDLYLQSGSGTVNSIVVVLFSVALAVSVVTSFIGGLSQMVI